MNKKQAREKHARWLERRGLAPLFLASRVDPNLRKQMFLTEYDLSVEGPKYPSHGIAGDRHSTADRSIMSNLHREKPETVRAVLEKASRVAPAYNKGALQLISDKE